MNKLMIACPYRVHKH